mgnify:CR=1 FL=1
MTIRILQAWNGYPQQAVVSMSASEETRLVGLDIASFDLDGPADNVRMAQIATDAGGNVFGMVVNTIADLKALSAGQFLSVQVLGYYAAGDGGGDIFRWNSTSTAADNGGTVIIPDSAPGTGRWERVHKEIGVNDSGAKSDGVTDDSTPIASARDLVRTDGGRVRYGGKTGGGSDTRALVDEYLLGSSTSYKTGLEVRFPLTHYEIYNGTPQSGAGFAHYGSRIDYHTKPSTDVQSSVGLAVIMQSKSTNTGGTATDNNTNQVAAVFNATAMDTASSASVTAVNVIGESLYTGAGTHTLNPFQVNINSHRAPGWFGETSKTYSAAATIINTGAQNSTFALGIDTSTGGVGFLHGALISGVINAGVTIARNTVTPDTGVWVSAATTYGIYVGAKNLYQMNTGQTPAFDTSHNPAVGIALGQRAATSGQSNKLRFVSTNGASAELAADLFTDAAGDLNFSYAGTTKALITTNGYLYIQGSLVVNTRKTGYSAMTGSLNRGAVYDTSTITLQQLAERVAALQQDLASHGLIGA